MLNIPYPLPDELVCSVIARAQRRLGIHGPKFANEYLLTNRNIIATPDFPSQLGLFLNQLEYQPITPTDLAYRHTLLPLYAPFIDEKRRQKCLMWMERKCDGNVHFTVGCAASRLNKPEFLRYCPYCAKEQIDEHGEAYWLRIHQIPSIHICIKHQIPLSSVNKRVQKIHRHAFQTLRTQEELSISDATSVHVEVQARIEKHVSVLLNLAPATSPSFNQWSNFYQSVLHEKGYGKGQYVCFDKVMEQVVSQWPINWLKKECLWPLNKQSSWLHSIIRKHRKSFSFLEHIVLLDAIYEGAWSIEHVLKQVPSAEEVPNSTHVYMSPLDDSVVHINKSKWLNLVKRYGTKLARINGGGAIYTWLYRYHNKWLLKTNSHYQRAIQYENNRVDWRARDWRVVRAMYRILYDSEADLDCPRRSALWFIHQLEHSATVEKKLVKLPLTASFLKRYAEDTTDYQIRRLTRTLSRYSPQIPPVWRLLRESGLSDERITAQAKEFIECIF